MLNYAEKIPDAEKTARFLTRAAVLFQGNREGLYLLDTLRVIIEQEDKPYDGLIAKLTERSGCTQSAVRAWLRVIRENVDMLNEGLK
jgi:hypothetical protein